MFRLHDRVIYEILTPDLHQVLLMPRYRGEEVEDKSISLCLS